MTMTANRTTIDDFLRAYGEGDEQSLGELLADDIVWRIGGANRHSGVLRGRDAVLRYFREVARETSGTLTLEPVEVMADEQHGAAFLRVTGSREGRQIDVELAEAFAFDDGGRIARYWATANDQASLDAFWGEA